MIKIGIKTYDDEKMFNHFIDKCDFFEIMAIVGKDYDYLKDSKVPIVIHSQHRRFGVNLADKNLWERNQRSIDFAIKIANLSNAKKIIVHPGELDNENCSKENSIEFIKNIKDKRIIIENIPNQETFRLGTTPEEILELMKKTKKGFCFDINHALVTAENLNIDPVRLVREFLLLGPDHYHLGGQLVKERKDHLELRKRDFDLKKFLSLYPKDANIALETEPIAEKIENDLMIMKGILKEIE